MELEPVDPKVFEPLHGRTAHIDGDTLVYRCGFSAEKSYYLIDDGTGHNIELFDDYKSAKARETERPTVIWSRKEIQPVEFALQATKTTIEAILDKAKPKDYIIYLSGRKNFRYDIADYYKGNRDHQSKPRYWSDIRIYLIQHWGARVTDGIEADDAIGIAASGSGRSCIVSNDKDLDQIAGWHFDWPKNRVYEISRKSGDFALYSQILSGDPTDNVPGLDGIGPVKAGRILEGAKNTTELFERCWAQYRDRYGDGAKKYFLEQARLIYIHRKENDEYRPPV
jgi:5'-3' exonuclease